MSIAFNAEEVFEMAEEVERNGAAFYRKAAKGCPDAKQASFLLRLADMEDEHERTFAAMRNELSDKEKELTAYDPDGEAALYLDAMADTHGGEGTPAVTAALTGKEPLAQILEIAIGLEKKSILFYLALKDTVPARLGKDRIERIIEEEKKHVVILSKTLHGLKPR